MTTIRRDNREILRDMVILHPPIKLFWNYPVLGLERMSNKNIKLVSQTNLNLTSNPGVKIICFWCLSIISNKTRWFDPILKTLSWYFVLSLNQNTSKTQDLNHSIIFNISIIKFLLKKFFFFKLFSCRIEFL